MIAGGRTLDGHGTLSNVFEFEELPVLCTQTALFSNSTFSDPSEKLQILINSNNDLITGYRDCDSFRFLGVRFAPQLERLTYPTVYEGSGQTQSALQFGSPCLDFTLVGSDDCLLLNIYTPFLPLNGTSSSLKPVMIFVHGVRFSAKHPSLDGASQASRGDLVVVVINYRQVAFGYLALEDGITNGNYGLADQIIALDWVRANIHDFGGDPERITILPCLDLQWQLGKFEGAITKGYTAGLDVGTPIAKFHEISEVASTAGANILLQANCTAGDSETQRACLRVIPALEFVSLPAAAQLVEFTRDGTYLTTDRLVLNVSTPVADVHVMMGYMRDDGAPTPTFPTDGNFTTLILPAAEIINSGLPEPEMANITRNVNNITARAATDAVFRCPDAATAYAGVQNGLFKPNTYFFEFNRSYQLVDMIRNSDVCFPSKTAELPLGDPNGEYFKFHSGDLYFTFGSNVRNGQIFRDENDVKFGQFVLDSWSSFVRTYDPNPDLGYLTARGYHNTIEEMELAGLWEPIGEDDLSLRRLQWPSYQTDFTEEAQCALLDAPLDIYV